nr:porin [uncultured Aquabacterium sp.]
MFAKKNLVAAAALLALVGAAQAQSSVKLYGYVEAGVGSFKAVDGKSTTKVTSGDMMTSFIGFSGSEDLGGGLKAEFALESFIGVDTGENVKNQAQQFWSRGSWVGLSGGFGKVALGQYDTPLFVAGLSYNPFGSSMTYSPTMRHFYNLGSTQNAKITNLSKADTGWINSLTYETPNYAGLTGTLQYSPKESSTGADSSSYTLGVAYNAGPLSAMVVYGDSGKSSASIQSAAYPTEFKYASFNASYDFGVVKAFGQFSRFKYGSDSLQSVGNLTSVDKASVWQLGVSVPVTASGTVLASYGAAKYKQPGDDASDKIFSVGYDHALSKRTSAYTAFTTEKLSGFKGGRGLSVGVKHTF